MSPRLGTKRLQANCQARRTDQLPPDQPPVKQEVGGNGPTCELTDTNYYWFEKDKRLVVCNRTNVGTTDLNRDFTLSVVCPMSSVCPATIVITIIIDAQLPYNHNASETMAFEDLEMFQFDCSQRPCLTTTKQNTLYCRPVHTSFEIQRHAALPSYVSQISKRERFVN
ncbi:hypothetical protein CSKR_110835 [Clonorchis sinensis]|uniref:Uncharacterized protein n=1 Tax=Clonorchis sinensis TaxID=79923 RepID=A0A3R7CEL8_CLOSI|nr:hypothetical protein CSKR_110835 [Clonorchis sinensis]